MAAYHTQIPPQFRWPGRYPVPAAQPSGDRSLYVGPLCRNGPAQLLRCIGKKVCGACQLSVGAGKHSLSTGSPQYGTVSLHLCADPPVVQPFSGPGRAGGGQATEWQGYPARQSVPHQFPPSHGDPRGKHCDFVEGIVCQKWSGEWADLLFGRARSGFYGHGGCLLGIGVHLRLENAGYDMILWLAGLDGISADLYEAASVDGANAWQKFFTSHCPTCCPP